MIDQTTGQQSQHADANASRADDMFSALTLTESAKLRDVLMDAINHTTDAVVLASNSHDWTVQAAEFFLQQDLVELHAAVCDSRQPKIDALVEAL